MTAPRHLTPTHPRAVATLGPLWRAHIHERYGLSFRPWQELAMDRALEIDENGQFCWLIVIISTPRQQGKSVLIFAIAAARAHFAAQFGEPQMVLHLAQNMRIALRVLQKWVYPWAVKHPEVIKPRFTMNDPGASWLETGSSWTVVSQSGAYGETGSLVVIDEGWSVDMDAIESALIPTMLERTNPQLFIFSTAHETPSTLIPTYRRRALKGQEGYCLIEWSAPPDSDPDSEATWQGASPHWTEQHRIILRAQHGARTFRQQYLNMWPGDDTDGLLTEWPLGWSKAPQAPTVSIPGHVAAIEVQHDRSVYGVAYSWPTDTGVAVVTGTFTTLPAAVAWITERAPAILAAAIPLAGAPEVAGPWRTVMVGIEETKVASPVVAKWVADGLVSHDHDGRVRIQTEVARVAEYETTFMLSARRSLGVIVTLKSVVWAVWGVVHEPFKAEKPAIY